MARVKSALEIALEKAGSIATFTQEEKELLQDEERLLSVLREFYQGRIDSGGLWQRLKGSKPAVLRKAQLSVIKTFGLELSPEDFEILEYIYRTRAYEPNDGSVEKLEEVVGDSGVVMAFEGTTPVQELIQGWMGLRGFHSHLLRHASDLENLMATMHESNLDKVKVGMPVRITVDALPGKLFTGYMYC